MHKCEGEKKDENRKKQNLSEHVEDPINKQQDPISVGDFYQLD